MRQKGDGPLQQLWQLNAETQESEELLSRGTSVVAVERLSAKAHESKKLLSREIRLCHDAGRRHQGRCSMNGRCAAEGGRRAILDGGLDCHLKGRLTSHPMR